MQLPRHPRIEAIDIVAAARRIRRFLPKTPMHRSRWLSRRAGVPVFLKLEALNLTRSFKIRGAFNALLRLVDQTAAGSRPPTVVTASAGNHGRAVAYAAESLGLHAVVFTPASAPRTKRDGIRAHGATLHDQAADYDAAEREARAFAASHGAVFVSPYNDADVVAGAGTVALEIVEACPDLGTVVVPLGGGGLASGVGLALRAAAPGTHLAGVEAAASTPFTVGLQRGSITHIEPGSTVADGLAGNLEADAITFPIVQEVVGEVVTVSESEIAEAMRALAADDHLIVEGAAAVGVAAVITGRIRRRDGPIAIILTGANVAADGAEDAEDAEGAKGAKGAENANVTYGLMRSSAPTA